jgi:hypothetical protein
MLFREVTAVYFENYIIPINSFCGQNAELLNVIVNGTYIYHCVLKGQGQLLFFKVIGICFSLFLICTKESWMYGNCE